MRQERSRSSLVQWPLETAFTEGPTTIFNKPGYATRNVVAADVNEDGQVDLAIIQRDGPGPPVGDGTPDFALWAASNVWPFRRGDANNDGIVEITDPSSILKWLFLGTGPERPWTLFIDAYIPPGRQWTVFKQTQSD